MDDEKAKKFVLKCLKDAGIRVVTDTDEMERVLGESLDNHYQGEAIQKMVLSYEEGSVPPDLSPASISFLDRNGKQKEMYTVKFFGNRPKDYVPKKLGKAYKLMEQWPDGTLHALFAGTQEVHPMGEWNWAKGFVPDEPKSADKNFKGIQSMKLAPRFGWHMGTGVPSTHHLMGVGDIYHPQMCYPTKSNIGHPKGTKRVWVEVSYDATKDYTPIAEANPSKSEKDIRGLVPFGGYYMFQESNLSNWIVASSIRFDRVIPEEERQSILKEAGYDEELMWRLRVLRTKLKGQLTAETTRYRKTPAAETAGKMVRLVDLFVENEKKIATRSDGKEPTYKIDALQKLASTCKEMKQAASPADGLHLADRLDDERQAASKEFLAAHPKSKRVKLTDAEIQAEREKIRAGIIDNPDFVESSSMHDIETRSGKILGFVQGDTVYLDPKQMSVETPIHEYVHLWDKMCQKTNPKLWEEGVALMKQTRLWEETKANSYYADIAKDDNLVASEVHARLVGEKGEKLLQEASSERSLSAKLKRWGKKFWDVVQKRLAHQSKGTGIMKYSREAFLNAPLADLVSKKDLKLVGR